MKEDILRYWTNVKSRSRLALTLRGCKDYENFKYMFNISIL